MSGPRRDGLAALVLAVALGVGFSACSSNEVAEPTSTSTGPIPEGEAPVRVELIDDAIAAVEAELGGPQQYFEIFASPVVVNLLVSTGSGQGVSYIYAAGELGEPEAGFSDAPTFAAAEVDFDPGSVLAAVRAQLATSTFRAFSITATSAGVIDYKAVVDSSQGTEFVVYLSGTGAILGTDQNFDVPAGEGNS